MSQISLTSLKKSVLERKLKEAETEVARLSKLLTDKAKESTMHKNTAFQYHIENVEYMKCIDDLVQTITEKDIVIEELKKQALSLKDYQKYIQDK